MNGLLLIYFTESFYIAALGMYRTRRLPRNVKEPYYRPNKIIQRRANCWGLEPSGCMH